MIGNSGFDKAEAAAVDISDNFWLGGSYEGTVDFDPGPGISILTSTNFLESFLASYDRFGEFRFAVTLPGFQVADMDTDSSGNLYVCGYHSGNIDADPGPGTDILPAYGQNDIFVLSFDPTGNYRWGRSYGSPAGDEATSVRVDQNGGIILAGLYFLTSVFDPADTTKNLTAVGGTDAFVASISGTGALNWVNSIGGTGFDDNPIGIPTRDAGGENVGLIYSYTDSFEVSINGTPTKFISEGEADIALVKYNSLGEVVWALSYGGIGRDTPVDMIADSSGNLYQTGNFNDSMQVDNSGGSRILTSRGLSDIFLISHTPTGLFQAATSAGGIDHDMPTKLTIKRAFPSSVILTGQFTDNIEFDDEIDSNGQVQSTFPRTSEGFIDVFVGAYNLALTGILKVEQFGGLEGDVGAKSYLAGAEDFLLTIGRSAGQIVLVDSSCDITESHTASGIFDNWVQRSKLDLSLGTSVGPDLSVQLFRLFPNPARNEIRIEINDPATDLLTIRVFNLQGQMLMEKQIAPRHQYELDIQHLPTGLYLLQVAGLDRHTYSERFVKE